MSTTLTEFAMQLAAEAEKRGLRIVIEPIMPKPEAPNTHATNSAVETHETELVSLPTSNPESDSVKKITDRDKVREEKSWITVAQCARMLNISTSAIYNRIRHGMVPFRINKAGVMTVNTSLLNGLPMNLSDRTGGSVPVECVETGRRYSSMSQASRHLKISSNALQRAMITGDMVKGYHFRPVGITFNT